MISEKMLDAFNEQIKKELYSSYLYLSMSAHFEAVSQPGFAKWTRLQAKEELGHALRIFDHINDRDGRVVLQPLEGPPVEWGAPLEIYQAILEHEQKVTASINALYALALKENDYASQVMLHWFINEQVEEEKNASLVIDQLRMAEDHKGVIIAVDRHVGKRESGED